MKVHFLLQADTYNFNQVLARYNGLKKTEAQFFMTEEKYNYKPI